MKSLDTLLREVDEALADYEAEAHRERTRGAFHRRMYAVCSRVTCLVTAVEFMKGEPMQMLDVRHVGTKNNRPKYTCACGVAADWFMKEVKIDALDPSVARAVADVVTGGLLREGSAPGDADGEGGVAGRERSAGSADR